MRHMLHTTPQSAPFPWSTSQRCLGIVSAHGPAWQARYTLAALFAVLPVAWAHADAAPHEPNQAAPASAEERERREAQRLQWLAGVLAWGPRVAAQQLHIVREWTLAVYAVRTCLPCHV